ncbi:MAG: hypothetical protein AB8B72_00700 [Crocinitomicaceae bacterium]
MRVIVLVVLSLVLFSCGVNNNFSKKKYLKLKPLKSSSSKNSSHEDIEKERTKFYGYQQGDSERNEFEIQDNFKKSVEPALNDNLKADSLIRIDCSLADTKSAANDYLLKENRVTSYDKSLLPEDSTYIYRFNTRFLISVGFGIAGAIAWIAGGFTVGYLLPGIAILLFLIASIFAVSAVLEGKEMNPKVDNKKFRRKYRMMVAWSILGGVILLTAAAFIVGVALFF